MKVEVTGKTSIHENVLVVSVTASREQGLYVQMIMDSVYIVPLHVLGDTHVGLFMIGDISNLLIHVFQGASEIGHCSYDVNHNGHLNYNVSSGVCLNLFEV